MNLSNLTDLTDEEVIARIENSHELVLAQVGEDTYKAKISNDLFVLWNGIGRMILLPDNRLFHSFCHSSTCKTYTQSDLDEKIIELERELNKCRAARLIFVEKTVDK